MTPVAAEMRRIILWNASATMTSPLGAIASPHGSHRLAATARPPSPTAAGAHVPSPANVVMIPDAASMRRILFELASEMNTLPPASTATSCGRFRYASTAGPPSPPTPATPPWPAIVWMIVPPLTAEPPGRTARRSSASVVSRTRFIAEPDYQIARLAAGACPGGYFTIGMSPSADDPHCTDRALIDA